MTDARHFKWWRTPIRLTQNWAKSTRKTTTWNLLQNVQHNPRNQGYQLLEWVYVTEYVTTGSLWVLKIPKVSLNTLKYKWKHYGTVAFTANPFPVQWFKLFFSNCLWNCVTATSSRLAEKIEKQDRSPHFPLWPGIIFPGRFLFISDVINAFQRLTTSERLQVQKENALTERARWKRRCSRGDEHCISNEKNAVIEKAHGKELHG